MLKYLRKTTPALLASLLIIAGCNSDTSWTHKTDSVTVPAGLFILQQVQAIPQAKSKLSENVATAELDDQKKLLKQTLEDMTVSQWVSKTATEKVTEYIVVEEKFAQQGLTLTDAQLKSAANNAQSLLDSSAEFYKSNGIGRTSLESYYANQTKKTELFTKLYSQGGELAVSADDLKAEFAKTFKKANYMILSKTTTLPEGETKTLEELNAETVKAADAYLKRLQDGEEIEELVFDYQKQTAADETAKAAVVKPEKGSYELIANESTASYYGAVLNDGIMKGVVGTPAIVQDDNAIYVLQPLDIMADPADFDSMKDTVLSNMKFEEYQQNLKTWGAQLNLTVNQAALSLYTPEKIKEQKAK